MNAAATSETQVELDSTILKLKQGAQDLKAMSLKQRRQLIDACAANIPDSAQQWVELTCNAKQVSLTQPAAAEEILAGPATLLRYLRLLSRLFQDVEQAGKPQLPSSPHCNQIGRTCVPILPVRSLFDPLIFRGLSAEVWLNPEHDDHDLFAELPSNQNTLGNGKIAGVLGAGNVSAIPATDMLYKIFHDGEVVLLKLNPVNEYLYSTFTSVFAPLIEKQLLQILRGGNEIGKAIVSHPEINSLHVTGSHHTHDAIVWGGNADERANRIANNDPLVNKPITSELGNVTPWIVVPGKYTNRQLQSQAEHVAASIVNNASFNCVATKMIVTSSDWPQRSDFLARVETLLKNIPPRHAYYPGARVRFERATAGREMAISSPALPWTLIQNSDPNSAAHLFQEESFVCVCAETMLPGSDPVEFLNTAVEFVNDKLFGTLCATITAPKSFENQETLALEKAISKLRYGSVCVNQWAGVVYGLMTPPWGGHPSSDLKTPQSGIGHVHNTFCLKNFEKTVLRGPLCSQPKPVWFHSHKTATQVGWSLLNLYEKPSVTRLPRLFFHALRG